MDRFESLAEQFNVGVVEDPTAENTFIIEGSLPDPDDVRGTGFFTALANQGIETLAVNGTQNQFTISDGEGTVTDAAVDAGVAIASSLFVNNMVTVTVYLPLGDGSTTVPVTYTFNRAN